MDKWEVECAYPEITLPFEKQSCVIYSKGSLILGTMPRYLAEQIVKEHNLYPELVAENEWWKECYKIAVNHLQEIESQYAAEHGTNYKYKEGE